MQYNRSAVRRLAPLILVGLASCRMPAPAVDPVHTQPLPRVYASHPPVGDAPRTPWWTVFASDALNELIAQAVEGSPTLDQFAARLRQAEAVARQAGARRRPELSATAEASSSRRRIYSGLAPLTRSIETYSLGLAASYELDLWGRIGAASRSARLDATASRHDLDTAAMLLVGQIADRWLQLVEAEIQIDLLRNQIETNQSSLELLRARTLKAGAPILDFYQQEQILRASEALLPATRLQAELLRNELALLTGRPAGAVTLATPSTLPELPPFPDPGLPADLLGQRPDLRAQWRRIEAAGWNVAAARADRLPSLRLTGNAAYSSDTLSDVFDDWLSNLAAILTGPILDGGRRRAEVRRRRAILDERLADYRKAVLTAFLEVDNALRSERRLAQQLEARRGQLTNAGHTLAESQRRYLKGAVTYLPVLTARRALQELQRSELTVQRQLLANRVVLYRAMGGPWTAETADRALAADVQPAPADPYTPSGGHTSVENRDAEGNASHEP